ncbi:hypothetical protein HanXRQr2_Chr02g0076561 [Helianthus annuus]|uniref:Uncharacterized protein n=1 Tax=Helianthus annuus TaxID=4232 RepID=A0A251VJQ6_HELAN|nr:uncharacterized protein LOC110906780 [Helianthus annuus]KAF5819344.1 hypothetical protein HanXRQr2_Chr02g0076561 [Helianthus annuus]KAJ0605501.1 hypothetical protein HanHA300_Chr02g0063741 [Helianthus annuus]KAJ0619515.1 hypothetical protein HanHA89_Chr02g0072191 [Helianthus annuus]KAJ0786987.1 hypothetical protein HanOQP8_Chr02g0077471 [Helianthus annuus]
MSTRARRVKWHTSPLPPTPKIINLPTTHSSRSRKTRSHNNKQKQQQSEVVDTYNYKGKLESLFGVDTEFSGSTTRRERVEAEEVMEEDEGGERLAAERWRFQAEVLRAECNFLRMERKSALKKVEKNRMRIERTLKSALKSVASGRKKLCEGKNMEVVLEEEMKELTKKLEELQSSYNVEEVNGDCSVLTCKSQNKSTDVSIGTQKSKGILDQMEKDYRSIINNSVASSASTSNRIDFSDHLSFSNRFSNQAKDPLVLQEAGNKCSGRCKLLVKRMSEQVRADTEQWSQMQEMLGQLRQEMEELQTSKDFWETQALVSNKEIQSLMTEVEEWRDKAVACETKADALQNEVTLVKGELEKLKKDQVKGIDSSPKKVILSLSKQIERETKNGLSCRMKGQCDDVSCKKDSQPLSLGKQLAREKRILISQLKENPSNNNEILSDGSRKGCHLVRSPFKDVGNSASSSMGMLRQNSNAIFPLH